MARYFCYLSTPFWMAFFATCPYFIHIYVHTLERQLHAIYSHILTFIWREISCYIFTHIYIHLKGNFYATYSHFWKAISCHIFTFWEAFSCYIQHMYALFQRYLPIGTYSMYTCTWWKAFSHHLSAKKSSWCNPNQVLV